MASHADRSVQEFRLDFTNEIKNLRVALTGKRYINGKSVSIFPNGLLCEAHFSELVPMVHLPNTKAWTLSRIHEEKAEEYVLGNLNNIHIWMMRVCFFCPDCGMHYEYSKLSNVMMMLETFFYGNFNRAVGGFEAEKLSTMQSIISSEDYRSREQAPPGFINKMFGRKR